MGDNAVERTAGTEAARVAKGRPTISAADRALATIEVQNAMSRHEYLHAAGFMEQDLGTNWVSREGKFAATATLGGPVWVMNGIETIRQGYLERRRERILEYGRKLAEIDPSVGTTPEHYGAGSEFVMHTSTTPIIEIAGDGRTAQGVWYSPGISGYPVYQSSKVYLRSIEFWEKYGVDFVNEDGVWKIWHMQMGYDFMLDLPKESLKPLHDELGDNLLTEPLDPQGELLERVQDEGLEGDFRAPQYVHEPYSPQRASFVFPHLPLPYYTFSESTFSNANCEQQLPDF